jgi:lipopolysaccharide heptosyltransferase III
MYKIINKKKLVATFAADLVGRALFLPARLIRRSRRIQADQVRNILVVRTAYIGDVVMTIPVLKPLRELFPDARISFLTAAGAAEVLKNNPFVDEVIPYDAFWFYATSVGAYRTFMRTMRERSFDLVIEARADIRDILLLARRFRARYRLSYGVGGGGYLLTHVVPYPGLKHKVEYHLDLVRFLGYRGTALEWGVYLSSEERKRVSEIMAENGIGRSFIAVHPGSRLPLKRWPVKRYGALCDELTEKYGMPAIVFGAGSEKALVAEMASGMKRRPVTLAGSLSLREMAGMLGRAALFICNDSAPMHLAAAMKTPTVAIFGPSKSAETRPYGEGHRVVEKEFACRHACDENTCRYERYNACMEDISVDEVLHAAEELLRSREIHVQT